MAKGNLLLGYGRGKVGSLVFSRRKGEQITRARNTAPANPRTNAQLSQRMKMYAPVKLYRQSMERFFKYAFSLKERETVFNAFMRENISIAPWASRELVVAQAPIPFPAHMSSGGLGGFATGVITTSPVTSLESFDGAAIFPHGEDKSALGICIASSNEDITVGEFSEAFLEAYPQFVEGDQVTFVLVHTEGLSMENGFVNYDDSSVFNFKYAKVVLDVNSTVELASLGIYHYVIDENVMYVGLRDDVIFTKACVGGCVIVTRNVGGKVDATNSVLALNPSASSIYSFMRMESYRARAAASYKASPDAYLNPATSLNE